MSMCGTGAPSWCRSMRVLVASASVSTIASAGVSNLVCHTIAAWVYRREPANAPAGRIDLGPAASSPAAKTDWLSDRGKDSHALEPPLETSAPQLRSGGGG